MLASDQSRRVGCSAFRPAGIGLAFSRNCLPGKHNVTDQVNGRLLPFGGAARIWHCAACVARRTNNGTSQ